ncbi:helix-turn-helix domain-containing protein [Planctomicrobium piriforme]|nr:AraC family transcriptional regulator [Planctomicrobium piriforme]
MPDQTNSLEAVTEGRRPPTYADLFKSRERIVSAEGSEFRSHHRCGLQLGKVKFREAFPGPPMPYFYLAISLSSTTPRYESNYGAGWYRREPNSFVLVPPGVQCTMRGDPRGEFENLFLAFPEAELRQIAGEMLDVSGAHLFEAPRQPAHDPIVTALAKQVWEYASQASLGTDLVVEGNFLTLIGRLLSLGETKAIPFPEQERGGRRIVRVSLDYMRENMAERLSLADIANAASVSRVYLARVFRQQTGRTVHDHLLEVRMERAKELIRYFGRNMTFAEIAQRCGFVTHAQLTRTFTQLLGVTPGEFRDQM